MEEIQVKEHRSKALITFFVKSFLIGFTFLVVIWSILLYHNAYPFSMEGLVNLHRSFAFYAFIIDTLPLLVILYGFYIEIKSYKEISAVKSILEEQSIMVEKTAIFADKIGKGEFNYEFKPFSEEDVLGKALIEMRDSLLQANRKETDNNWIVTCVAEVGEILRRNNELLKLSDEIISFLPQKINAVQGAFYIVNNDDEDDVFIELVGSYAYNRKKYLKGKFKIGQGLVGQAVAEQDIVYRTEIPSEYVTITSGLLGDQKPKSILIVPLITNEKVYGAIEFAGFETFTSLHIKFIKELSDILARTIFNVKVNERTVRLLNESQKMSSELTEQREKLLENALEMQTTQEEIKKTNLKLEDQIEEVNKSQQRTHVLLENASEVINIYDEKGNIIYVSPSVKNILGYDPNELLNENITKRIHEKGVETVEKMFTDLNNNPAETVSAQYTYVKTDGSSVWVESTGRNLIKNPYIKGILINTVDITERRKAEKEQRERAKMQALSENSPDVILRFDLKSTISYVNPTILKYTGLDPSKFLFVHIDSLSLNAGIIDKWHELLATVSNSKVALSTEMEFLNSNGNKHFMKVNVLPEFDANATLESILMILHDITEAKIAEREIQVANEKIQDSINYAKRIQNSILPKEIVLQDLFKESFMLFRPKDVVSGDFPFIVQKGDNIYFAAVDCTGHGVPGALLSLIGSLILNEILTYETLTPALVLDTLHAAVVKTLRQGQIGSENERDGMDVCMCRLNVKTGEFMFSGAHRPLYIVRHNQKANEDLEEVKGDKYPIGGVQYRGRENFTNFETVLQKGDKVFLCSDGYPDQFGGTDPVEPKKIGPKKIRELLVENRDLSMVETHLKLVDYFDEWKGVNKQIDDVLFIGIKYLPIK